MYFGNPGGQKGVGFILKKELRPIFEKFQSISDRMAILSLKVNSHKRLIIIQIYAPTSTSTKPEIDNFYKQLSDTIDSLKLNQNTDLLIMGDFNGQIRNRKPHENQIVGPYGYNQRNRRGGKLINFCQTKNLKIVNSFFKKRNGRKWTWVSPNGDYKNQIDYMLAPHPTFVKITDFDIQANFNFHSDHRLIKSTIKIPNYTLSKKINKVYNVLSECNKSQYLENLQKILSPKTRPEERQENTQLDVESSLLELTEAMLQAESNIKPDVVRKNTGFPTVITQLCEQRNYLKNKSHLSKTQKIELNLLSKIIRKKIHQFKWEENQKIIQEILDDTKSTKKINKKLALGKCWMSYMLDSNNGKLYEREQINKHASSYYAELYKANSTENNETNPTTANDSEDIPPFMKEEIRQVVKNLHLGKAPGHDKIKNEHIKYRGEMIIQRLTTIFNLILSSGVIPNYWKQSDIILLFKKGNKHKIENYRPISLSPTLAKIFSKLIEQRLTGILKFSQGKEQAGFKKGFSTIDHLHTIKQISEKSIEHQKELHLLFIDYTKAFDSLNHGFLLQALKNQGVPDKLTKVIQSMYTNLKARVTTDISGEFFNIGKGVKQGDPLSPLLFNSALEEMFKNLKWEGKGIKINGSYLNNLRFADDIVLISDKIEELREMLMELELGGRESGLEINIQKTKLLTRKKEQNITLNGKKIEHVDNFTYLGQQISFINSDRSELERRIAISWKKFWSLKHIFKGNFQNKLKSQILNSCVFPAFSYGCQTWALTKADKSKIITHQNDLERAMLNVKKIDKIKLKLIKKKLPYNMNFLHAAMRKKWDWGGHVARMESSRWAKIATDWYLDTKRKKGKQKTRWGDDFAKLLKNNLYHRIADDRHEWARLREAFARSAG